MHSKNLKYQVLGACEHPVRIKNRYTGDLVTVTCGKCKSCRLHKASKYSLLCGLEEASFPYTYFVTLTYADRFIPKMKPVVVDYSYTGAAPELVKYHNHYGWHKYWKYDKVYEKLNANDKLNFNWVCITKRLPEYRQVLSSTKYSKDYVRMILQKTKLNGSLSYLSKDDLQKFLKRLRKYVSKISSDSLRFYAVGEYGPNTYRCHWHILLHFTDGKIAQVLSELVSKSWRFGRVDCSASRGSASSYVSSYVNSFSFLPDVYSFKRIRPRCYHSFHYGFSFFQKDIEEIYKNGLAFFDSKTYLLGAQYVTLKPPMRFRSCLYPRCIGFSRCSLDGLFERYSIYAKALDVCKVIDVPFTDVFSVTAEMLSFNDDSSFSPFVASYLNLLRSWCPSPDRLRLDFEYCKGYVYSVLSCSRHFLDFCCGGDPTIIKQRVCDIWKFYKDLDYENLIDWYKAIEEYSDLYPEKSLYLFYECPTLCYGEEEYNRSTLEFQKEILANPVYQEVLNERFFMFDKSIKHKQQNDMNQIFIDSQ